MRRSDAGFTLLEVMAAVAFIAIVFTTLARVANEGLQSQGISKRRLEASLLADGLLSEIEAQVSEGTVPEIGHEEFEEGIFDAAIDVAAFDLASVIPASTEAPEAGATTPLTVRRIEIAVTWIEAGNEFQVIRTTFGLDLASIPELPGAGGAGGAGGTGGTPAGSGDLTR